jgi:hypothetical protein
MTWDPGCLRSALRKIPEQRRGRRHPCCASLCPEAPYWESTQDQDRRVHGAGDVFSVSAPFSSLSPFGSRLFSSEIGRSRFIRILGT